MAPSTLLASGLPEGAADRFQLDALVRFYAFHARIYDWTRSLMLFGRRRIVEGLGVAPGMRVLDVGCGTGFSLPGLVLKGASVRGIDCSQAMLDRASRRLARRRLGAVLDSRPYATHEGHRDSADRILFSYSLSMMPPFREVLANASLDLRRFGRIGVVDFLDAGDPLTRAWLEGHHVFLGDERLNELRRLFPRHRFVVTRALSWRYFLFWGDLPLG